MITTKKENLKNTVFQSLLAAAAIAAVLPMPDLAVAQNLAGSVSTIHNGLSNMPNIVAGAFYVGGAALIGAGALKLKAHSENPGQTPLGHGLGRVGAGAGLVALPSFAQWLIQSLGVNGGTTTSQGLGTIQ